MNKFMSFLSIVLLTLYCVWVPTAKAATNEKIDYVALGDSLASGHTPYGDKVGRGFTDIISETLAKQGELASFTKEYAASGQTSVGLLDTLKRDDARQALKEAELITIISGANDFIDEMYNSNDESIDKDLAKATALLDTVAKNLTTAIQQVKALNSDADIYMFGYYFPVPHLTDEAAKLQLQIAFNIMNTKLRTIAEDEGIHFVEVASVFDLNGKSYLENPKDIHPNETGYQVIADQFFQNYSYKVNKTEFVEGDKKWIVNLNNEINPASVQGAVFVVKDGNQLINVGIEVPKDNQKQLIITSPIHGYKTGSYQLMITTDLTDKFGKMLLTKTLLNFNVE